MKQRILLIVLSLVAILIASRALAQIGGPGPVPPARSYLCFEAGSAAEVTRKANEVGARGWKMTASGIGNHSGIWCFEQLRAARPVD